MSAATRRITKEFAELQNDMPQNAVATPDENNLFHWVFSYHSLHLFILMLTTVSFQTGHLLGPSTSAYKGGKFKIDVISPFLPSNTLARH